LRFKLVTAAYIKVRLIPRFLRALPPELYTDPSHFPLIPTFTMMADVIVAEVHKRVVVFLGVWFWVQPAI
jgi:hypothetical protein